MKQVLHGFTATTAALCRAAQNSQESLNTLADCSHINLKTIDPNGVSEQALKLCRLFARATFDQSGSDDRHL